MGFIRDCHRAGHCCDVAVALLWGRALLWCCHGAASALWGPGAWAPSRDPPRDLPFRSCAGKMAAAAAAAVRGRRFKWSLELAAAPGGR